MISVTMLIIADVVNQNTVYKMIIVAHFEFIGNLHSAVGLIHNRVRIQQLEY